jgi:ABC-2 type transport system ATP-binding protein
MEVRRVLRFLGELKGMGGRSLDVRIDEWLERMSLRGNGADWSTSKVDELSRGMQQKVQFIGALLHDPELVILDEPFSGLDPINAQALKDTVVDLKRQGRTVIFSTHIMDNAERLCDSVCIIAGGEKVLDGAVADVRDAHGTRLVALGLDGAPSTAVQAVLSNRALVQRVDDSNRFLEIELAAGADAQQLLQALVATGAPIERFERVRPSLHRIFLEKVGATHVEAGMSGHG